MFSVLVVVNSLVVDTLDFNIYARPVVCAAEEGRIRNRKRRRACVHPSLSNASGCLGIERRHTNCEMKAPWVDHSVWELVGLSVLAGGGCGLALAQGDLLFVAVFGAASAMAVIGAVRRSR